MLRAMLSAWILTVSVLAAQSVEGQVLNAATGAGVPDVRVRIFPANSAPRQGRATITDAQGRFQIDDLKEGVYGAMYDATGFEPIPNPGDRPAPFAVRGGDPVRLAVKIKPLGSLSGRVLDGAGEPVANAGIWLVEGIKWCMPPACSPFTMRAKANEKGEFTVPDMRPGWWMLSATAPPTWKPPEPRGDERVGWMQTFYPGVTDPQLAEAVMVKPGSEEWRSDIKLLAAPVHRVRGRVLDGHGDPVSKVELVLEKGFGPAIKQQSGDDGTFEFESVMDGEWRASAAALKAAVKLTAVEMVEVRGRDVEKVELRLSAPFTLKGKIVVEVPDGTPAPEAPSVDLVLTSNSGIAGDPTSGIPIGMEEGVLTSRPLYPGVYEVLPLSDAPAPYYLDSIRLGDRSAVGGVTIVSDALPLTIAYRTGGGSVRGTVEGCDGGQVFLVAQDPALRVGGFRRIAECDRNGRFEFAAVRPGEYYGLALAADTPLRWHQISHDAGLLSGAAKVTVRAGEATTVDLRISGTAR
jgi:uncharacterized GH25 family protein